MVNSGYSRELEFQADQMALVIMKRAGYDPRAFDEMLNLMKTKLKPGGPDFAKTHPDPKDRVAAVEKTLAGAAPCHRDPGRGGGPAGPLPGGPGEHLSHGRERHLRSVARALCLPAFDGSSRAPRSERPARSWRWPSGFRTRWTSSRRRPGTCGLVSSPGRERKPARSPRSSSIRRALTGERTSTA